MDSYTGCTETAPPCEYDWDKFLGWDPTLRHMVKTEVCLQNWYLGWGCCMHIIQADRTVCMKGRGSTVLSLQKWEICCGDPAWLLVNWENSRMPSHVGVLAMTLRAEPPRALCMGEHCILSTQCSAQPRSAVYRTLVLLQIIQIIPDLRNWGEA